MSNVTANSVRFCRECSNMLYPKQDVEEKKLLYACRICEHTEDADDLRVYVHQIQHHPSEQFTMISDVAQDPTLPHTTSYPCPKCGGKDAVFFQSRSRRQDSSMALYYVCCSPDCGWRWIDQ